MNKNNIFHHRHILCVILIGITLSCAPYTAAHATEQATQNAPAQKQENAAFKPLFNAESMTLDNGMQVIAIPNHRIPVVTHMVWYKTGGADEQRGKTGVAHLLEHMMFKGSENVPPGEFSKIIKTMGGNDNAFTSLDYTAYFQSVSVDHLKDVMTMEADRMRGLLLPENHVPSERDVVIEERRQVTENDAQAHFAEHLNAALFLNHRYGRPVIGWMQEIENIDRNDLQTFHDTYYAPNNAILIVSGDITLDTLKPLAEEIYGTLPRKDIPPRTWRAVPDMVGTVNMVHHDARVRQTSALHMMRAPSFRQDRTAALALQLIENILSDGAASRLYKKLVVENKMASSVSFSYSGAYWSNGRIWFAATPLDGVDPADIIAAYREELLNVVDGDITDTELQDAKTRLIDRAVFARDSLSGPAMIVGRALVTGSTLDDVEYWARDLNAITQDDIREAAQDYLDPRTHAGITGFLYPEDSVNEDAPEHITEKSSQQATDQVIEQVTEQATKQEEEQ